MKHLIEKLDTAWERWLESEDVQNISEYQKFEAKHGVKGWELFFCPEKFAYQRVLKLLRSSDVVFDVGAGDLRFALMMAQQVKKVYAVEINPVLLSTALGVIAWQMPENLTVICANAFTTPIPEDVTIITCLMIHRQHSFPDSWMKYPIIATDHTWLVREPAPHKEEQNK